MIKRRFYKLERGDKDSGSDSSSFSSDSDLGVEASEESEDDSVIVPANDDPCSTTSGHENEESSGKVANDNIAALADSDDSDDIGGRTCTKNDVSTWAGMKQNVKEDRESEPEAFDFIIKCKSVFKCRICPSVICLNEETIKAHVRSKRHARSERLLKAGRLKAILHSNGEREELETVEEEQTPVLAPKKDQLKKKSKTSHGKRKNSKRIKKKSIKEGESKAANLRPNSKKHKIEK